MKIEGKNLFLENGGVLLQPEDKLSEDELSEEYMHEPVVEEKKLHD